MLPNKQMRSLALVSLLGGAVACGDSGPELAPSQIRISIADEIAASTVAPTLFLSVNGAQFAVDPADVEALTLDVTDVLYLMEGDDENSESSWQSLGLADPVSFDLMALPAESQGSVPIAAGDVPVGAYSKVRLLVSGGQITFNTAIPIGGGQELAAGMYDVTVPSGDESGIKSDVSFEVIQGEAGAANSANLVFEPGTTFQNVTVTGNGAVVLNPVLRAK